MATRGAVTRLNGVQLGSDTVMMNFVASLVGDTDPGALQQLRFDSGTGVTLTLGAGTIVKGARKLRLHLSVQRYAR